MSMEKKKEKDEIMTKKKKLTKIIKRLSILFTSLLFQTQENKHKKIKKTKERFLFSQVIQP